MRYDFHVHTRPYSPCALSSPEEVCRKALERGLTGIALTEHDLWWPREDYVRLQRMFPGLVLFRGVECACDQGHFLVLVPDPEEAGLPDSCGDVFRLATEVRRRGGVLIWAHPFRYSHAMPDWLDRVNPDGLEVDSTNMNAETSRMALDLAAHRRIMPFRNSDCHDASSLGMYFNEIPHRLENTRDVIDYIRRNAGVGNKRQ